MSIKLKYYVYRHIRLDTGVPFYVGIGSKRRLESVYSWEPEYERAYSSSYRSNLWNHIAKKHGWEVEIMFETNDPILLREKEIEFIALYGRRDQNLGSLVNFTDGGDGTHNVSQHARKIISQRLTGIVRSEETRKKIRAARAKQIMPPRTEESKYKMSLMRMGSANPMFGKHGLDHHLSKSVYQYTLGGKLIKKWINAREASKILGISWSLISYHCRKGKAWGCKGFLFRFS